MQAIKQLKLDLWGQLTAAEQDPIDAELSVIWDTLDRSIFNLPHLSQLEIAGDTILRIAGIHGVRSNHLLPWSKVQQLSHPPASELLCDPVVPWDAFDDLIRQSSHVDFDHLINPISFFRSRNQDRDDDRDEPVAKIPDITINDLLDLAGAENPAQWSNLIDQFLSIDNNPISFVDLCDSLKLPQVEVWIGAILGGSGMSISRTDGDFYDQKGISVEKINKV